MLQLTYESFPKYGSSNLYGLKFAKQDILYSLSLLYTFLYNQYVMYNMMNSLSWIPLYLFYLNLELNYWQQTI